MENRNTNPARPPHYFIAVLVVTSLPLLGYPFFWAYLKGHVIMGINDDMMRFLIYALPVYIIASQWMSYWIYNERKNIAWVLQFTLLVTYGLCLWMLHLAGAF